MSHGFSHEKLAFDIVFANKERLKNPYISTHIYIKFCKNYTLPYPLFLCEEAGNMSREIASSSGRDD